MDSLSRRTWIKLLSAGAALALPFMGRAAQPRVVVVGGGAGGASAARALALDKRIGAQVTMIEPSRSYHTCFFSNLYLGGFRDYASISHGYAKLADIENLNVVHDWAHDIDAEARHVTLGSGARISYDRLILSPGIDLDYDSVPGYSVAGADIAPHAWKSGTQVQHLRARALAMKPGGTFVYVAPPDPSRCPPGPYERVSMLAHLFKTHNPNAKIIVLDPKEKFSKQGLFQAAWEKHYPGMILWLPPSMSGGLDHIDLASMTFSTSLENFKADAASVVPAQRAAGIAQRTDLTDASGWCPIMPDTLQSSRDSNIHIIGDAAIANAMPKSAFAANNQAHAVAIAVRHSLLGEQGAAPTFANTCWSLLAANDSVKVGASYKPGANAIESTSTFVSQVNESVQTRAATAREAEAWYAGIVRDMFG